MLSGRGGGEVRVAGRVEAQGTDGGSIWVTGEGVRVGATARLDASGRSDGGEILLGGGFRGTGDLRHASDTMLEYGSDVRADGGHGEGGLVVAWAVGTTWFDGRISAVGAARAGVVETSAQDSLGVGGHAEVTLGRGGEWLLDPRDVAIVSGGNPIPPTGPAFPGSGTYQINAGSITQALNTGTDVTVTTVGSTGAGRGDIDVNVALSWTGAGNLKLEARRDIDIFSRINTQTGNFTAAARRNLTHDGSIAAGGAANVSLTANRGFLELNGSSTVQNGVFSASARTLLNVNQSVIANGSGDISLTSTKRDVNIDANVIVNGGNLTAFASRSLNTSVNLVSNGAGDITLTADRRDMRLDGSVTVNGGDFTARAYRDLTTLGQLVSNSTGEISVATDTRDIVLGGPVTVNAAGFRADAGRNLRAAQPVTSNGAGDLDLDAGGSVILDGSVTVQSSDLMVDAGKDVLVNGLLVSNESGDLTMKAGGRFELDGAATLNQGNITATAADDVQIDANIRINGSGAIGLRSTGGGGRVSGRPAGSVSVTAERGPIDISADAGSVLLERVNASAASNIQVWSRTGDVSLSARDSIRLVGGSQSGRWVRLGMSGSSSTMTLDAREILVSGGSQPNTFAEVMTGAGGALRLIADEQINVLGISKNCPDVSAALS